MFKALKKHFWFWVLGTTLAALIGSMVWATAASAQAIAPVNPYQPVPEMRYPICTNVQTASGSLNCTGNPNAYLTRPPCGNNCPEDQPGVYDSLGRGTLNMLCGDPEGEGCVGALFIREGYGDLCIRQLVRSYDGLSRADRAFAVLVSDLRHMGPIDLVLSSDGSHPRYTRRYERQIEDYRRLSAPVRPGYSQPYNRSPCRH